MLETVEQRNSLLASVEKMRNSSVLAYVLHDNAMIADDALPQLYDKLQAIGKRERIDLFLYARNGIVEVSWRVLNLIRDYCDHLGVIVGTRVQGAASLLALGADEVVMGPLSELGGMEPVRRHPLLPHDETQQPMPVSLGELKSLMRFLADYGGAAASPAAGSTQDAELAHLLSPEPEHLTPELLTALFQYVHPLVIGNLKQTDTLCREVTERALRMHMNDRDAEKIERLVDLFNGGFRSPIYTASRGELREAGLPVTEPDKELWSALWGLVQLYQASLYTERPENSAPGALYRYVCIIEVTGRSTGLRQTFSSVDGQERVMAVRWDSAIKGPGPGPSFGPGGRSMN